MIIQTNNPLTTATKTFKFPAPPAAQATQMAKDADTVIISKAAQAALAATQNSAPSANSSATNSVDAKLAEIQRKDAFTRTAEDMNYLWANDPGLAALQAKRQANPNYSPTAAEIDHEQKAIGFVNTMANLSPAEKDLYDKAVASGNKEAAAGISQIAFIRTMGLTAGGAPGTTYDPINTTITPENIKNYFSYSIVDPSGKAQAQFQALIQFLENNPTTASS